MKMTQKYFGKLVKIVFSCLKKLIPKKYSKKIKDIILYRYVIMGKFNPIKLQKICFFYLPDVPDFGREFTYIKLGKKEKISNPNDYSVIFEADLPDNLTKYNKYLLDYSGLYALYKNDLIKEDHILLIHYDTQILHPRWLEIINYCVKKNNVLFSDWPIDNERSEAAKWVYEHIDDVFMATHGQSFLSFIRRNNLFKLPNTSQFACKKETFCRSIEFLLPIYERVLLREDLSFRYAHLLERAWGLFFALEKNKVVLPVIRDSHSQSGNYDPNVIHYPLLLTALKKDANSFSEVL